jgi:hypothetical protein
MPSFVSKKMAFNNAEQFKESFFEPEPATIGYVFIGKHTAFTNEDVAENITDTVVSEKDLWDNMYAGKKITGREVELVIPRINWTANTKYRAFDDTISQETLLSANVSQNLKPMYIFTTERNVYKCLSNNLSANSTVEPSGDYDTANGVIDTVDGYSWKYMFNVQPNNRFLANDWVPAPVSTTKLDFNINETNVVDGQINDYVITSAGTGYYNSNIAATAFTTQRATIQLGAIANVTTNMSISGTGIAPLTHITAISNTTNTITLSTATVGAGGGVGNTYFISTRISVTGDGTDGTATAQVANGSIIKITPSSFGQDYRHANVTIYGSGSNARARAVLGPKDGHAFNPAKELGASNVMIASKIGEIDSTEGGLISDTTTFRQYGLLRDPHKYGSDITANNISSNTVISQTHDVTLVAGSAYEINEYVYQGSANNATFKGYINAQVSNLIRLTRVEGTIALGSVLVGANSATSRVVVKLESPEFEPYTGDILYAESIVKTQRAEGQTENIRFVIKF